MEVYGINTKISPWSLLYTFDPQSNLASFMAFDDEKENCLSKEKQVDFMYKYYSPGVMNPLRVAEDFERWEMELNSERKNN